MTKGPPDTVPATGGEFYVAHCHAFWPWLRLFPKSGISFPSALQLRTPTHPSVPEKKSANVSSLGKSSWRFSGKFVAHSAPTGCFDDLFVGLPVPTRWSSQRPEALSETPLDPATVPSLKPGNRVGAYGMLEDWRDRRPVGADGL